MIITHPFKIDLSLNNNYIPTMNFKQVDTNSHKLLINLLSNATALDLTNHTTKIYIKKPDNTEVFQECTIEDVLNGQISCILTSNTLAVAGTLKCEISIYGNDGSILATITFLINVIAVLRNDASIESSSDYSALSLALASVQNIDSRFASVNSQLAAIPQQINDAVAPKANQTDLDTANNNIALKSDTTYVDSQDDLKRDKSIKIYNADLADEVKQAMAGTTSINATPGVKTVGVGEINSDLTKFIGKSVTMTTAGSYLSEGMVKINFDATAYNLAGATIGMAFDFYTDSVNALKLYPKLFTSNTLGGVDGESKNSFTQWVIQQGLIHHVSETVTLSQDKNYIMLAITVPETNINLSTLYFIRNITLTVNGTAVNPADSLSIYTGMTGLVQDIQNLVNQIPDYNYVDASIENVYADSNKIVDGYEFNAKNNAQNLVQPVIAFDLSGITYNINDIGTLSFKIKASSANISKISGLRWFLNEIATVNDTSGTQVQNLLINVSVPQEDWITVTLTKALTIVKSKIHCYTDITLISNISTEFQIYDISFSINGNYATKLGTALLVPNSTDTVQPFTSLPDTFATHSYVNKQVQNINLNGKVTNSASGKKIAFLGHSYTVGVGTTKTYWQFICDKYGIIGLNYGVAGSSIGGATPNSYGASSMLARYSSMDSTADAVVVIGPINDWAVNTPMGTMADRTSDTFYGSMHLLCQGLRSKYPTKGIGFMTEPHVTDALNTLGLKHIDYINTMKEVCEYYSILFIDIYNTSGISLNDATGFSALVDTDHIHALTPGHALIASRSEQPILSLIPAI